MRANASFFGITLVEVMVALVIVALALGAGLKATGTLTNNAQRLEDVTLSQWCAENELIEMRLTGNLPATPTKEMDCLQLGRKFHLSMKLNSTPNPMFKRVNIQVLDEAGQLHFSIKTILPVNVF